MTMIQTRARDSILNVVEAATERWFGVLRPVNPPTGVRSGGSGAPTRSGVDSSAVDPYHPQVCQTGSRTRGVLCAVSLRSRQEPPERAAASPCPGDLCPPRGSTRR